MTNWDLEDWVIKAAHSAARKVMSRYTHTGCEFDDVEQTALVWAATHPEEVAKNSAPEDRGYIEMCLFRAAQKSVRPYAERYVDTRTLSAGMQLHLGLAVEEAA